LALQRANQRVPSFTLTEPRAARQLVHLTVTIIDHHHRRAAECARAVVSAARALGRGAASAEAEGLLHAYDALASRLEAHMHEEEERLLDRVQVLWAQQALRFGSLARSATTVATLEAEHREQLTLAFALDLALRAMPPARPDLAPLVARVGDFLSAFRAHVAFEDEAFWPVLTPFLEARSVRPGEA
jgi:iron-sulfur cluster repair protein YtfE (RIC family)